MKYLNDYTVLLTYTEPHGGYYEVQQHVKDGGSEWRATLECQGHNGGRVFVDLTNDGSPSGLEKLKAKIARVKREKSPHGMPYTLIRKPHLATFEIKRASQC